MNGENGVISCVSGDFDTRPLLVMVTPLVWCGVSCGLVGFTVPVISLVSFGLVFSVVLRKVICCWFLLFSPLAFELNKSGVQLHVQLSLVAGIPESRLGHLSLEVSTGMLCVVYWSWSTALFSMTVPLCISQNVVVVWLVLLLTIGTVEQSFLPMSSSDGE